MSFYSDHFNILVLLYYFSMTLFAQCNAVSFCAQGIIPRIDGQEKPSSSCEAVITHNNWAPEEPTNEYTLNQCIGHRWQRASSVNTSLSVKSIFNYIQSKVWKDKSKKYSLQFHLWATEVSWMSMFLLMQKSLHGLWMHRFTQNILHKRQKFNLKKQYSLKEYFSNNSYSYISHQFRKMFWQEP